MIDLEKIRNIEVWKRRQQEALYQLEKANEPSDLSPQVLLGCYKELYGENWAKVENTKIFLFVYMYNFVPSVLAGVPLRNNNRRRVAEMLGIRSVTSVSIRIRNLMFYYQKIPAFRRKVDNLQRIFVEQSKEQGKNE